MNAITPTATITRRQSIEVHANAAIGATRFLDGNVIVSLRRSDLEASIHLTLAEARELATMLREVVA